MSWMDQEIEVIYRRISLPSELGLVNKKKKYNDCTLPNPTTNEQPKLHSYEPHHDSLLLVPRNEQNLFPHLSYGATVSSGKPIIQPPILTCEKPQIHP